jgi:TetR/AcrR family transcriptional repressor of nem operon
LANTTKQHIIEVASRLMHLQGYGGTSVDDILRESGVGKGNFYYYFKSKEALGYAIIERNLQRFSDEVLTKAFASDKDGVTQINDFLDMILELHRKRNCAGGCLIGNMAMEMSDVHQGFRKKIQHVFETWRKEVADAVRRSTSSGRLTDDVDSTRMAQFIIAGVEGGILLARVKKDIGVLENCFAELKTHIGMYVTPDIVVSD